MSKRAVSIYDELVGGASSMPVSEMLPSLLMLAHQIKNAELEKWAKLEMEGYIASNTALSEGTVVPNYRNVPVQYLDRFRRPLIVDPSLAFIQEYPLRQGAAELEKLSKSSGILTINDTGAMSLISKNLGVEITSMIIGAASLSSVLSAIRTRLISWLGDIRADVENSRSEKQRAAGATETLALTEFHPKVTEIATSLFENEHYRQAVLDTYIALVQQVQAKSGREKLDGTPLMQTVFSPKKPLLQVSEDENEQQGYMWLFSGAVMAIRNARAHRVTPITDAQRTLEWLAFASALFRILDDCQPNKAR